MRGYTVKIVKIDMLELNAAIASDGFGFLSECLGPDLLALLQLEFPATSGPQRDLLALPSVQALARSAAVRNAVEAVLGGSRFAVRGLFFNKTPEANWKVSWHQDLTISVRAQKDVPGFTSWSMKAGAVHVQPPPEILERMLALRIHLDDSTTENGPLRCVPGTHVRGRLSAQEIAQTDKSTATTCCLPAGDALLVRPLVVHASSKWALPMPRRVIHLEFADIELPHGLRWRDKV
jgi:ectoine hydroxylase-related dioxygenase (phytanoyl-CoA dioxygenase family)